MNVTIESIKKSYGERQVLNIPFFDFPSGKITGIMGQNGAGKSTLLRIIAGLDMEFEGRVQYDKSPLSKEIYAQMTMVFQTPYLLKKTVYENIAYPLKLRKMNKEQIDLRVKKMMELFQITALSNKLAHKLSGGESQKVALARAIVFEPKLLLLDEPMSGIDINAVPVMEHAVTSFCKDKGATIIMITHSKEQAKRLCDKTLFLDHTGSITDDFKTLD